MRHSSRRPAHKGASARNFRKNVSQTHPKNVAFAPRRGGWRL